MYESFDHTADVGLRVRAATFEELLADAARALFAVILAQPQAVQSREVVVLHVDGQDYADLLVDWLSELLHRFVVHGWVLGDVVTLVHDDGVLTAHVAGESFDPERHGSAQEVKAVTYHGLRVERLAGGWQAEVILDL